MVKWGIICLVGLIAAFVLYVRLAPSDPARWHKAPPDLPLGDSAGLNSFVAVRDGDRAILERLIQIAEAAPRTERFAGSADEGLITFITRTRLWGFPDYTTAQVQGEGLVIFARLRFGSSDLGVNAKRLRQWIAQL